MNVRIYGHKTKNRSKPDMVITDKYNDVYNASHILQNHTAVGDYTTQKFGEQIVYTSGRRNVHAKSNYCHHKRESFYYGGTGALFLTNTSPSGWTTEYFSHHAHACNARASVLTAVESALGGTQGSVLGGNAQAYINEAFDKLQPDLTSADIPNFLAELDDVKRLFSLWKRSSSVARNLAGAHLNYKFGWKPTVSDIRDAIGGLLRLKERLQGFKENVGKTIQVSTGINLGLPLSASGSLAWPSGSHQAIYSASCTRKCNAYLAYKPRFPAELNGLLGTLQGVLATLGFELNPSIIWNALPFTFVVDWFLGIGTFLNRLRIDTMELPIDLVDGWVQYKETLDIEWTWLRANDGTYTSRPKSDGAFLRREFFHRMPIYPDFASLAGLGWKLPTLNQALLGVSLATVLGLKR